MNSDMIKYWIAIAGLLILAGCNKNYEGTKNKSHLEYLGIEGKAKEMKVTFFSDELSGGVYIPQRKIHKTEFNFLDELFLYPNPTYNTVKEEYVTDGRILKHLLVSYLNNPIEFTYIFDKNGNISKVNTKGDYAGNAEIEFSYDDRENITKIISRKHNDRMVETFEYDENNLLKKSSKTVSSNGVRMGGLERSYTYSFSAAKIICSMNDGTRRTIFEIVPQDEGVVAFGNENYTVKFKDALLVSEEEYVSNELRQSTKNTFNDEQLVNKKITSRSGSNSYIHYTLHYNKGNVSRIEAKRKGGQKNYTVHYEMDSKKNWKKLSIADESAFRQYRTLDQKIKQLDLERDSLDERKYISTRAKLEVDIKSLQYLLNQRRCERTIIY